MPLKVFFSTCNVFVEFAFCGCEIWTPFNNVTILPLHEQKMLICAEREHVSRVEPTTLWL